MLSTLSSNVVLAKAHAMYGRRLTGQNYKDLLACGSLAAAKEKGLVRLEGKDYVMQDGDIVLFRFNV